MNNPRERSSRPRRVSSTASKPDIHPIFELAKSGAFQEVMDWIEREPELVKLLGWLDTTLLHVAVDKGDVEFTQFLLDKGADVNAGREKGALCWAKNAAAAKLLLDHGAIIQNRGTSSALSWACRYNRPDVVKLLLEYGALIDGTPPESIWSRHAPIFDAAENPKDSEDAECLRLLVESGADINFQGTAYHDAPIYYAAMSGSIGRFELLMAAGAKFERALLYNHAQANVKTYIESKYPELAQEEWELGQEELAVIETPRYLYTVKNQASFWSYENFGTIIRWEIIDNKLKAIKGVELNRIGYRGFSLSSDGVHLAVPHGEGKIQIRDAQTLKTLHYIQFPTDDDIELIQYSPNGAYLVAIRQYKEIYVLNLKTGSITASPEPFVRQSSSLDFSPVDQFFSFFSIETGGDESGIFRIEEDGGLVLIEYHIGDEDINNWIIMHPYLPYFIVQRKVYRYELEQYQLMQARERNFKNGLAAEFKWELPENVATRHLTRYFYKDYLIAFAPQKITCHSMESGEIVAEHHFDFNQGESLHTYLGGLNKIVLSTPQGNKIIDNPILL